MSTEFVNRSDLVEAAHPVGKLAPRRTRQSARAALAQRVLVVTGQDAASTAPLISVDTGGLVVAGSDAAKSIKLIRQTHSEMTLLIDPISHCTAATPESPFDLGSIDGLFAPSVGDFLDGQIANGASLAVAPSKFIEAGDIPSLKALLTAANDIERDDVLVPLPLAAQFMTPEQVRTVIAVAKRIEHPVAITLGSQTDPLASRQRIEAYRQFFSEVPDAVAWRTDLAGFGAMARGAAAAAIGQLPSLRRINEPGRGGRAQRPGESFPHLLVPELMRFARANVMQENWFASATPWVCACSVCGGRAIANFSGSPTDRLAAHKHNAAIIQDLHTAALDEPLGLGAWWVSRLREAQVAHVQLSSQTSVKISVPPERKHWMDVDGA